MPVSPEQPTMPNPALKVNHPQRIQAPVPQAPAYPQQGRPPQMRAPKRKNKSYRWLWLLLAIFSGLFMTFIGAILLGLVLVYNNGILPSVTVNGVALGGLSQAEASQILQAQWDTIVLRDGNRTWSVNPTSLGLQLDSAATAQRAYEMGRNRGNPLQALFGGAAVSPIVSINTNTASAELTRIIDNVNIPPIDAGVTVENAQVVATQPKNGRSLDVNATINRFADRIAQGNSNGEVELVMVEIAPAISDASPILAQVQALLNNPLDIKVYDPVTGDSVYWSAPPDEWVNWLTIEPNPSSAIGISLSANPEEVRNFLSIRASTILDDTRSLDIESGVQSVVQAIADGQPSQGFVQVKHKERSYTVQAGETITSIAWDFGIPYLYIQQLNGGIESVAAGQTIKLPPADIFLTEPVNPNKRIVVSISGQKVIVYEDGQVKWDWVASTGIPDSPTWTGIYQIQSHVDNAYAANWNLYMPNFLGVYQPVPGADFTNGFHGFPTRGGGQLLWENSLGTKVTYGCILLSNTNIQQLYTWAEVGTVVEIQS